MNGEREEEACPAGQLEREYERYKEYDEEFNAASHPLQWGASVSSSWLHRRGGIRTPLLDSCCP